jgi:nicotinamidase-related amidase
MTTSSLIENSQEYLQFVETWLADLPILSISQAKIEPAATALISVDIIKGFCTIGPLSSPRVNGIVQPITRLMSRLWQAGVRHILLSQDTHEPDAVEFGSFPPHCVRGTEEAETVEAFKQLPFFSQMHLLEKNSIATGINTELDQWIGQHPEINTFIVVGDCSDLCTYQLAMHLRLSANDRQLQRRVIAPADCIQTYDMSVKVAAEIGGVPHPGDLLHHIFLHHMALNGIEVIGGLE